MLKIHNPIHFSVTIILLLLLSIIGILMQYSAGNGDFYVYALSQTIKVSIGFILLFIIYNIKISFIFSITDIIYILCLILVIAVNILGSIHLGAQRWLRVGSFAIQPSELMKVALIMMLAKFLYKIPTNQEGKLVNYILPATLSFLPFLLILGQPDLGTAIIILLTTVIMFFISGLKVRYFVLVGLAGIIITPLLWLNLYDYQKQRIITFINPESDPLGSGYHIIQSKIAIGSGGFVGKGFLNGSQSQLDFIPEKQTDFVFALFTEEFGFIGAMLLLLIYTGLIINSLIMAYKCNYTYGKFIIIGITSILFCHVFINIGMVSGILPVVGVPLPLVSFGGTSLTAIMLGFGLILNINKTEFLNK
ncbi:rod shape-determining protein RodA [Rickettsiales bacterium LUAb2]